MLSYFKLPNTVMELKLSSTEVAVAAALYAARTAYKSSNGYIVTIKQSTLCERTGIKCKATVCNAINKLSLLGVITNIKRRYKSNGQLGTYQYTLAFVGKYSIVNRKVLSYGLSPALLRVYLFLNKSISKKLKHCWNSYKDISEKLNMSRSRVIELVKELISKGLIICNKITKSDGSYSDNHYSISDYEQQNKKNTKKKGLKTLAKFSSPISHQALIKHLILLYNSGLTLTCQAKGWFIFYFIRGSPKNIHSIYNTHYNTHRKRKRLYLTTLVVVSAKINNAYKHTNAQNRLQLHQQTYKTAQQSSLLPP